jgi:1,3-beta-glucanosyltransferase GAS5
MNVYLHCQGNLNSIDEIVGFKTLLEDFTSFQLNIPVVLTEYGCISDLFPADGIYESQRDWFQVQALFDDSYETEFAGGFVFEYNTELVNSISPYPFTSYGPGNFGVGYLTPDNCNEQDVTCSYVPFPQFDQLASRYLAVDMNKGPNINDYVPEDRQYPTCPEQFPKQSDFVWPEPVNLECPEDLTVVCPNLPPECNIPTHPTTPVATPVVVPRTPTAPVPVTKPVTKPITVPVTKPVAKPRSPSITDYPTNVVTTFYPTIADLNVLNITKSSANSVPTIYVMIVTIIIATTTTILFFT